MSMTVTLICPDNTPDALVQTIREHATGHVEIGEAEGRPMSVIIGQSSKLTLSYSVRIKSGDQFSKTVLGMWNHFKQIPTSNDRAKKEVIDRVINAGAMVGIEAEPKLVDEDGHYELVSVIAKAMNATIFIGGAMLDADFTLMLDEDGNTEL